MSLEKRLFDRIEANVQLRKLEKLTSSKQQWIKEAVQEKLEWERQNPETIPENKNLRIDIDSSLKEEIEKRVDLLKKRQRSYSKKKWLVDAFYEKLEREEANSHKIMKKLLSSFKTTKTKA